MRDIHHREIALNEALSLLKRVEMNEDNRRLILDFSKYEKDVKNRDPETMKKTINCLRRIAGLIGSQCFKKVTRKQMDEEITPAIRDFTAAGRVGSPRKITVATVNDYMKNIKKFYKWLNGGDDYPKVVKGIKLGTAECKLNPTDMITEEELLRMIQACDNLRDKALISTLFDSCARVGEFLNLTMKDVTFEDEGAFLSVPTFKGKKEPTTRQVYAQFSKPFLAAWMNVHPGRKDKNACLWVNLRGRGRDQAMSYDGVKKLLRVIGARAGITKPLNPHNLRHSGNTSLASHDVNPQTLAVRNGHKSLKMAMVYTHLSGKQQKDEILRKTGKKPTIEPSKLLVHVCARCKCENAPGQERCDSCGTDLSITENDVLSQIRKEIKELQDVKEILMVPGVQEAIEAQGVKFKTGQ